MNPTRTFSRPCTSRQRGSLALIFGSVLVLPSTSVWAQSTPSVSTLPSITVTGAGSADGDIPPAYAGGQVAQGARLGMLGNQDIMDTPFNVTSYTAELIANQQARTLADVLANDPSVRFTTSSGHAYENFRIRGFDVNQNDVAIHGMYGLAPLGHIPMEFVERVEVLKGPSALFSGMAPSGAVGGTVNLALKRAHDDPNATMGVNWQADGHLGTTLDVGRRFGADNTWGVRLNGAFAEGATTLDGQSKKREFLAMGLDYRGRALSASLDAWHSQESFRGGTPAMFWFAGTSAAQAPDPRNNQFSSGWGKLQSNTVVGRIDYRFSEQLQVFAGLGRYASHQTGLINGTHARNIDAGGNFAGSIVGQRAYTDTTTAEGGLRTRFATGPVGHELVLHASRLAFEDGSITGPASVFASNIYRPIRPLMPPMPGDANKNSETTLSSLALVDTLILFDDALRLTAGLRDQRVRTKNFNAVGSVTARYNKHAVTPALGVIVKPWGPSVSIYANYVQGLSRGGRVTDTAASNFGEVFAPYETEQKELGIKWDSGTFTNTLAWFEITRPTMITRGPPTRPTYSDDGEKRIRGMEWNTFGALTHNIRVLGGLTYTRGTQTKTAFGQFDGNVAVGAPRWQANLGLEWDTPWMPGLTLSSRVQASTKQYANAANTLQIPGWGQLDLGARYTTQVAGRDVMLRLSVNNVFDHHYYAGIFSDTTPIATLGPARTVTTSVSVSF